ncbi:RNA polymerase sigma-70 factor [Skermania sp. ID1734]|uniref:RNA polymerase sigma-70 factor n=1 Tax=Skermania sp. ID1734 TaxID=2597516 RepID=UPI00117D29A0|nr:RNA polymerase sigma-70 factor [Skermania sp. ID1734]TSE01139.1 RNA polymerase sigma-70 factor [Skermania sp. ID1734]
MSVDPFVTHRSLLFTVAYELLGSAADAEDAVQEAYLRWDGLGPRGRAEVIDPRAYLVRVVSRQALNRLRTLARRKEDYVGEWLPSPVLTTPDVAEDVELAESVSLAMLTVLETLTPTERAVFVLREVFDLPFDEIAAATGKTSAAVRQLAHRARSHVAARRPRVEVDQTEQRLVVSRFVRALETGDIQGLMDALAPDAVLIADGGGVVSAARVPVSGAKKIVNLLRGFPRLAPDAVIESALVNGAPGLRVLIGGAVDTVIGFAFDDGRIRQIFAVRNPDKLTHLSQGAALRR